MTWAMKRGLALDGLPHVGVEAALGDVAVDADLGVLVALAQDAARRAARGRRAATGSRGGAARRRGPGRWCRRPSSRSSRPARDLRRRGRRRTARPSRRRCAASWMNRTCSRGHAARDELVAQLVVGVPASSRGGAEVAEHELQRPAARRRFAVAASTVDVGRGGRARCSAIRSAATSILLGVGGASPVDQAQVQRGLRPSAEILSMLSSSGATAAARTASARSPRLGDVAR